MELVPIMCSAPEKGKQAAVVPDVESPKAAVAVAHAALCAAETCEAAAGCRTIVIHCDPNHAECADVPTLEDDRKQCSLEVGSCHSDIHPSGALDTALDATVVPRCGFSMSPVGFSKDETTRTSSAHVQESLTQQDRTHHHHHTIHPCVKAESKSVGPHEHSHDSTERDPRHAALVNIVADGIHNFVDGAVIGQLQEGRRPHSAEVT